MENVLKLIGDLYGQIEFLQNQNRSLKDELEKLNDVKSE